VLDYAEQLWTARDVELWFWVTAGSREAIVSGYARLAADLTGVEESVPEDGAQRLLEWLAATLARWLIVLDDVQNPDLMTLDEEAITTSRASSRGRTCPQ